MEIKINQHNRLDPRKQSKAKKKATTRSSQQPSARVVFFKLGAGEVNIIKIEL